MIDEKRIITNLEAFSFPRLSGTEGENKAFNLALEKIRDLEIEPEIQKFTFSTFFSRVYQKIVFSCLSFFFLYPIPAIAVEVLKVVSYNVAMLIARMLHHILLHY